MIDIKNTSSEVIYSSDAATTREAVERAVKEGVDLDGANLTNAYLGGADLADADLADADLADADLADADLTNAHLRRANLRRANLADANLRRAYLRGADLTGANLTGVTGLPAAPVVPDLDARILAAVTADGGRLDMSEWHACETTHCRAGWAIHLAGKAGYELEKEVGASAAGALIYWASTGRIPDFFASNDDAMADIRKCAEGSK